HISRDVDLLPSMDMRRSVRHCLGLLLHHPGSASDLHCPRSNRPRCNARVERVAVGQVNVLGRIVWRSTLGSCEPRIEHDSRILLSLPAFFLAMAHQAAKRVAQLTGRPADVEGWCRPTLGAIRVRSI